MKRFLMALTVLLGLLALIHTHARPISAGEGGADPEIHPGDGVTKIKKLSEYLQSLADTPGDTPVYFLEGREEGGTVFVAAGTHANEIAGILAATVLIERAQVQKGRLIVIPHANNSASTYRDPRRPAPPFIMFKTSSGDRQFRYGARLTKPEHQGENDPAKYRHPKSAEELDGSEARNLDRAYPGRADGNLTEKVAWAILELIRVESADVAFDLHESGPESRLAWMVVAHPKSLDLAALAILDLDAAGIPMKLEPSSETFRGLSHREWGDATKAHAFLFETPNPGMTEKAAGVDLVNDPRLPLAKRVGVQLSTLRAILDGYNNNASPALSVRLLEVPGLPEVVKAGLPAVLK